MRIAEIKIENTDCEIYVDCDNGMYRAQGYCNGKAVTVPIEKSVFLGITDAINETAGEYNSSTVKAIENCGIKSCSTLEDAWQAISNKMQGISQNAYADIVDVITTIITYKVKQFFTR